jgi:hypothetical protein
VFRDIVNRLRGRKVVRHKTEHKVNVRVSVHGENVDADAIARQIEAEVARSLSEGNDPGALKANLEDIAERHGGKIDELEDR